MCWDSQQTVSDTQNPDAAEFGIEFIWSKQGDAIRLQNMNFIYTTDDQGNYKRMEGYSNIKSLN